MATSPIYNWPEPDNTDLVKNGALAIRTLGDAIDTTMATMTPKSLVDAKGDLIAASAADTPARLAVGNNGETLVCDSSTSTGLRYQGSMAAGKNAVINGAMDIWQRGTSIAGTTTSFSADRWQSYRGVAGSTFSRQTGTEGFQYATRVQRDSGNTSTTAIFLSQNFETVNSIPYAGKTVTLSFYARKGADYSRASDGLSVSLLTGTGTDQNGLTAPYTGSITAINQTATLTTSWQRFTYTATLNTNTNEINITYGFNPVGTAGANDWYEITGVQLEIGSVATNFTRAGGTIQGELAACQRYYQRVTAAASPNNFAWLTAVGACDSSTTALVPFGNQVTFRVTPTVVDYGGSLGLLYLPSSSTVTSITLNAASTPKSAVLSVTGTAASSGAPAFVRASADATAYIGVGAEL